jgi:hypothetical protein
MLSEIIDGAEKLDRHAGVVVVQARRFGVTVQQFGLNALALLRHPKRIAALALGFHLCRGVGVRDAQIVAFGVSTDLDREWQRA